MDIRNPDHKSDFLVFVLSDVVEDIFSSSWDDAPLIVMEVVSKSFHGVGFPCSRLSVSKDSGVVAFKGRADRNAGCVLVDLFLTSFIIIDMIENELVFSIVIGIFDVLIKIDFVSLDFVEVNVLEELNSFFILQNLNGRDEDIGGDFTLEGRPDPDDHFHIIAVIVFALFHYLNIINFNRHPYY